MRHYKGNERVAAGIYFNPRELSFASVDGEACLPGAAPQVYVRVPTLALLVVAPIIGGAYVIFLPLIGFAMLAWVVGGKLVELAARSAAAFLSVLQPAWKPAIAFLSRGKPVKRTRKGDAWAEGVKKQLERRDDGAA